MAPATRSLGDDSHKCDLPMRGPDGNIVYFDAQKALPGSFVVPGVIDLETYPQHSIAELSWLYFKGNPQSGPRPGHPFDFPFDNRYTTFQLDLVKAYDEEHVVQNIMPATNSSLFWRGGAPFGRPGQYSMYIPRLGSDCTFDMLGQMIYLWTVPESIATEPEYRVKLTTATPSSTHLSGLLRVSSTGADNHSIKASSSSQRLSADLLTEHAWCAAAGLFLFILSVWGAVRLYQRQRRIQLA